MREVRCGESSPRSRLSILFLANNAPAVNVRKEELLLMESCFLQTPENNCDSKKPTYIASGLSLGQLSVTTFNV